MNDMLDIDTAIKHCLEVAEQNEIDAITYKNCKEVKTNLYEKLTAEKAENDCRECANDHRQLAEWLTELKELREQLQKAKSMILDYSYTVEVMCNRIKNTMGCENCTYCNEETCECKVGAYIARTRAFVKGGRASESD